MSDADDGRGAPLTLRGVLHLWWPLAASWLMMGLELPLVNAAIARLPEERVHLAAFGSLVFPLSLLIEAPIIPLLAASTALSRDRTSHARLFRFALLAGGLLTLLHAAIAFTPLFDLVALSLFDMEPALLGPGRVGMQLMLPWTFAIAYRRFQQGVLIRAGHPRAVGVGTVVRLVTLASVLAAGLAQGELPGIVVGASAVAAAVTAEALFAAWAVRPVLAALPERDPLAREWSWRRFAGFYSPLALWSLVGMVAQPITSAAIGRMPRETASFAVWPAVNNLVFLLRSASFALNEVVVASYGRPDAPQVLSRFSWRLGLVTSSLLVLVATTPLASLWFGAAQDLDEELVALGVVALLFAAPFPLVQARMSLYTGALVHAERTRGVAVAVVLFIATVALLLALGTALIPWPGAYQAPLALTAAAAVQGAWLLRARRRVAA